MKEVVTCRPADKIEPEWDKMVKEAKENGGDGSDEDTLTYAMFPKVAPKFFKERANGPVDAATAFAKKETPAAEPASKGGSYTITVNGSAYNVTSRKRFCYSKWNSLFGFCWDRNCCSGYCFCSGCYRRS